MKQPAQLPKASDLLAAAYSVALTRQSAVMDQWLGLSFRLGSQLPDSLLAVSIQRCGRLDALVRDIENEFAGYQENSEKTQIYDADILHTLSESWISSAYAILFVLKRIGLKASDLQALYEDSRLIRVALEKHEIPSDRSLKEPITLQTAPSQSDDPRTFIYDKADPFRSHIMPSGMNPQGVICWQVADLENSQSRWLSRRYISDRMLGLLSTPR